MVQLTIGAQPNSETAYNWFFDNEKYGARFDASTAPGSPTGSNGLMHHNVGYNINAAIMQKGMIINALITHHLIIQIMGLLFYLITFQQTMERLLEIMLLKEWVHIGRIMFH